MVNRRGASSMGCLTVMIIFGVAGYVGMQVGEPYYRFYQFKDAVQQEVRFATMHTDDAIKKNLYATADSLDSGRCLSRQGDSDADTSAHPDVLH